MTRLRSQPPEPLPPLKLLASERDRFLKEEWPLVIERIQRLGLDFEKLMRSADKETSK